MVLNSICMHHQYRAPQSRLVPAPAYLYECARRPGVLLGFVPNPSCGSSRAQFKPRSARWKTRNCDVDFSLNYGNFMEQSLAKRHAGGHSYTLYTDLYSHIILLDKQAPEITKRPSFGIVQHLFRLNLINFDSVLPSFEHNNACCWLVLLLRLMMIIRNVFLSASKPASHGTGNR